MPQKIKFTIVQCTSEEAAYPASELQTHTPQTKGWQSKKFCDYPQELVLQLEGEVQIQQIQFLSHEAKIATRIELYSGAASEKDREARVHPRVEDVTFRRLGYLSLDSNEGSGHRARELKTVHIPCASIFLKLVLQKCHVNNYNLYNQVGLVAVNILGDVITPFTIRELGGAGSRPLSEVDIHEMKPKAIAATEDLALDISFDPLTAQKIRDLSMLKEKAVQEEDYDEAKRIKLVIDYLRGVGTKLAELEQQKKSAVLNEDYDRAKQIKIEIDRLRQTADARGGGGGGESAPASSGGGGGWQDRPVGGARNRDALFGGGGGEDSSAPSYGGGGSGSFSKAVRSSVSAEGGSGGAEDKTMRSSGSRSSSAKLNRDSLFGGGGEPPAAPEPRTSSPPIRPSADPSMAFDDRPIGGGKKFNPEEYGEDSTPDGGFGSSAPPSAPAVRKRPPVSSKPEKPALSSSKRATNDDVAIGGGGGGGGVMSNLAERAAVKRGGGKGGPDLRDAPEWINQLVSTFRKTMTGDLPNEEDKPSLPGSESDARLYFNNFSKYMTQCVFSKTWQHRESALKALTECMNDLPADNGDNNLLVAVCRMCTQLLASDKIPQVILAVVDFLKQALQRAASNKVKKSEISSGIEPLIVPLMVKIGDSNARIREACGETMRFLARNPAGVGPAQISAHLLRGVEDSTKKAAAKAAGADGESSGGGGGAARGGPSAAANNPKLFVGRLQILSEIIKEFKLSTASGLNNNNVMDLVQACIGNPNNEVRACAVGLASELYRVSKMAILAQGTKSKTPLFRIENYLGQDMKAALKEQFDNAFRAVDDEIARGGDVSGGGGAEEEEEEERLPRSTKAKAKVDSGSSKRSAAVASSTDKPSVASRGGKTKERELTAESESLESSKGKSTSKGKKEKEPVRDEELVDDQPEEEDGTCHFCGRFDPSFMGDGIEPHFLEECPMLSACPFCEQVIEIAALHEHTLKECEIRKQLKQCSRCKEQIPLEEHKEHVASKSCTALKSGMGRCILCHSEVGPDEDSWKAHILTPPGCPGNLRKLPSRKSSKSAAGKSAARR